MKKQNKVNKRIKHIVLYLFCIIGIIQNLSAQVYPVQVVPTVLSPYSSKLSDYSNAMVNRINLQLISTDVLMNRREVDLRVKIQGNGITAQSSALVRGARPIYLNGGEIQSLSSAELATYFRFDNLQGISSTQYSNPLPDGVYTICFQVLDKLTQKVLSTSGCSTMYLMLNDPPLLNIPSNKEEIATSDFPHIIFSWTPRQLNATNVSYQFELKELLDPTMDPSFAFEVSRPLYKEDDLRTTTLVYDINKPNLLPGKRYAWRVRAISTSGLGENSVFKNNGYSSVYSFTYSSNCSAPRFLLSEQQANNRVKVMWQGENSQQRYHVQYRKAGVQDAAWFDLYTVNTQSMLSNLEPGFTYEFRVGASCQQASYGVDPSFTYSSIQTFRLEAKNNSTTYNCGIIPDLKVTNQQPLGGLVINETFMAGDFPVKVLEIDGSNGVFSGRGYIVVPYLFDTRIEVEFFNVAINTDYQLVRGVVETTYDPDWKNVEFVDNLVDTNQQEITVPFPIADLPEGIQVGPGGDLVITGDDGRTETFPGGKDTVITDSAGQVYYVDKEGNVSGVTAVAEGGKPTPENTDGVAQNGEVTAFTAEGISVVFESDRAFDAVAYKQALTSDYKKIGQAYLPFKAVIKGSSAQVLAKVTLTDHQIAVDSLVFKTSRGVAIEAQRISGTTNFELTLKGTQSNAIEEVQVSIKQGNKYKVAGAFKLVHLSPHTVDVRLVPTSSSIDLAAVAEAVKAIYAEVGVRVNIDTKPVFDISAYLENDQLPTVKDDKLSTYSDAQQRLFRGYQDTTSLDKAYYLFVTDKASSTGVGGYMRLNGQYGFVFNALKDKEIIGRVAAHEFGHGAFKLEHPFTAFKSKGLREGATASLMDYGTESTAFIFTDWQQINDPKLKLYAFQGQGDGALGGAFDIAPNGKRVKIVDGVKTVYFAPELKVPVGTLPGFITKAGVQYKWDYKTSTYISLQEDKANTSIVIEDTFKNEDVTVLYKEIDDCKVAYMYVRYSEIKNLNKIPDDLDEYFTNNFDAFSKQKIEEGNVKAGISICDSDDKSEEGSNTDSKDGHKHSKGNSTVYNYTTEVNQELIDSILDELSSSTSDPRAGEAVVKRVLFISKKSDNNAKEAIQTEINNIKSSTEQIVFLWIQFEDDNITFDLTTGGSKTAGRFATNTFTRFIHSIQRELFGDYYLGSKENPFKLIFDGMAQLISKGKIPEKYYNPEYGNGNGEDAEKYSDFIFKYYHYIQINDTGINPISSALEALDIHPEGSITKDHIEFAYICGEWNGIVELAENIPGAFSLVAQGIELAFSKETQREFGVLYDSFKASCKEKNTSSTVGGCLWDTIIDGIADAHTKGNAAVRAQQYGKTTIDVISIPLAFSKVGKLGQLNRIMDIIDPINQILKYSGKGIKVVFTVSGTAGKKVFNYTFDQAVKLQKYELQVTFTTGKLYAGLPLPDLSLRRKVEDKITKTNLDDLIPDEQGIRILEVGEELVPIGSEASIDRIVSKVSRSISDVKDLLINSPLWMKNNSELLEKLRDKSNDFIKKVDDFYSKTMNKQTPAGFDGGEKIYNGVWFNKYGFPDFEKMEQTLGKKYNFIGAQGNYDTDFSNARDWLKKQVGIEEVKELVVGKGSPLLVKINGKWKKITWHHHEDGKTLIPVDSDIHSITKHTGGVKTTELKINNIFDYE